MFFSDGSDNLNGKLQNNSEIQFRKISMLATVHIQAT